MSKNIKNSPLKLLSGAIQAAGAYDWGGKRAAEIAKEQEQYDAMRSKYMGLDTSNLYSDVANPYANMENVMAGMPIAQQQAQMQREMLGEQQAGVLGGLRGAVGGSGIGGLAQSVIGQGARERQAISADIGQQEKQNLMAQQQMAGQIQQQERSGEWQAGMTRRAGAEQSRTLEKDKVSTLFTMATNRLATSKEQEELARQQMWEGAGTAFSPTGGMF